MASRTEHSPSVTGSSSSAAATSFEPANLPCPVAVRVKGMMAVRDAVRYVFKTQLEDAPEHEIIEARRLLNRMYDAFVYTATAPSPRRENLRAFAGDPDQPLLLSLENYDPETKRAHKTAIFERRTLERYKPATHVETAAEALAISLNETGKIDWPRMTASPAAREKQLQRELDDLIYRNPEGGEWETADRYLSGDVRAKLKAAESAAALDPAFRAQCRRRLKAVQPADLLPGDISARLGAAWIPASDIRDFICETLDVPEVVRHRQPFRRNRHLDPHARQLCQIRREQHHNLGHGAGTGDRPYRGRAQRPHAHHLRPDRQGHARHQPAGDACRARSTAELKERFSEWVWKDEERAQRLARYYNDTFNNLRLRTYDGSHLTFPGMNRTMSAGERPGQAPEGRRLANPAERQHLACACGWGRQDRKSWSPPRWR